MTTTRILLGSAVACLLLLLVVSLVATHALATLFIAGDWVAWAFALHIELVVLCQFLIGAR